MNKNYLEEIRQKAYSALREYINAKYDLDVVIEEIEDASLFQKKHLNNHNGDYLYHSVVLSEYKYIKFFTMYPYCDEVKVTKEELDLMTTPLEKLALSNRAYNILQKAGYKIFYDIVQSSENDLTHLPGMGPKTYLEIKECLERKGLKLGCYYLRYDEQQKLYFSVKKVDFYHK